MFEAHPDPARIVPSQPLGPDYLRPLRARLEAVDPGRLVVLDLSRAPIRSPRHVAGIMWVDDVAHELGLRLEIFTPDMVTAEMMDFAGVRAPVSVGPELPAADPVDHRRASAY